MSGADGLAMAMAFEMHWFSRAWMEWTLGHPIRGGSSWPQYRRFPILDGGHVNAAVCANGGMTNGVIGTQRMVMEYWCGELNKFTNHC